MGNTGIETSGENTVNCGAKPQGDVSAVASAVALHPVSPELLGVIRQWETEHGSRDDGTAVRNR
ncbi:hypothetical protein CA13_08330 [Planctomycetes bacterium CA13]|uniref:Uncharacterized protein n=1 Tax=Novipirellula herctigrandis TaxID=2527986 RepID=A0A5C5YWP9_9BACT|nr:hypothetical protein CA13_08330 [Planctomycetes bacterium CA13]